MRKRRNRARKRPPVPVQIARVATITLAAFIVLLWVVIKVFQPFTSQVPPSPGINLSDVRACFRDVRINHVDPTSDSPYGLVAISNPGTIALEVTESYVALTNSRGVEKSRLSLVDKSSSGKSSNLSLLAPSATVQATLSDESVGKKEAPQPNDGPYHLTLHLKCSGDGGQWVRLDQSLERSVDLGDIKSLPVQ